jgi:hypothetical protein
MNRTTISKVVVWGTCLFLTPFCAAAYFAPMSSLNQDSIGLLPAATDPVLGLSNIRGAVGGVRLGIIAMAALGTWLGRRDLCLGAAILVASVALGRFLSLGLDGWHTAGFGTGAAEVVITAALLHLAGRGADGT